MAGDLDFANAGGTGLIQADLEGADLVALMGLANRLLYQVMASPNIQTPADLRGRTLAVSRGSTDQALWGWYLQRNGLDPKDVHFLELPSHEQQMNALRDGRVQAMTLSPAGSTFLRKEGFTELSDFEAERIPFQLGCVVARRAFIEANPETARAFVLGYVAGLRRYRSDRVLGLRVLGEYTGIRDPEVLDHTYDVFTRNFDDPPAPSPAGFQAVLHALALNDPRAAGRLPEEFIDTQFL